MRYSESLPNQDSTKYFFNTFSPRTVFLCGFPEKYKSQRFLLKNDSLNLETYPIEIFSFFIYQIKDILKQLERKSFDKKKLIHELNGLLRKSYIGKIAFPDLMKVDRLKMGSRNFSVNSKGEVMLEIPVGNKSWSKWITASSVFAVAVGIVVIMSAEKFS